MADMASYRPVARDEEDKPLGELAEIVKHGDFAQVEQWYIEQIGECCRMGILWRSAIPGYEMKIAHIVALKALTQVYFSIAACAAFGAATAGLGMLIGRGILACRLGAAANTAKDIAVAEAMGSAVASVLVSGVQGDFAGALRGVISCGVGKPVEKVIAFMELAAAGIMSGMTAMRELKAMDKAFGSLKTYDYGQHVSIVMIDRGRLIDDLRSACINAARCRYYVAIYENSQRAFTQALEEARKHRS